jgi:hypothetical protein
MRYTLNAKPPANGSFTYRVIKRADADQPDTHGDRSLIVTRARPVAGQQRPDRLPQFIG